MLKSIPHSEIGSAFYTAIFSEPVNGVTEGLFGRGLGQAQFTDGLGRVEKHFVGGHANAGEWGFGWFVRDCGDGLIYICREEGKAVGDPEFRSWNASDFLEKGEGLFHGEVALGVAENVALADAAFFRGKNVADGDIVDVDPIEAGVEVGGHFAIEKINDDLTGGRGFDIARADGRGGIDDDDGDALSRKFERNYFRVPF